MIEYFMDKTKGKVPVSFSDIQSPLNMLTYLLPVTDLFMEVLEDPEGIKKAAALCTDLLIDFLKEQRGVAYVIDQEKAAMAAVPEPIRERVINGYNRERSGAIQIVLNPGWYEGDERGTTHGVWCPYDAHVPLIFMGWGVNRGKTFRETHLTDISATLAALLKIQMPNGCIGQPITEIIK